MSRSAVKTYLDLLKESASAIYSYRGALELLAKQDGEFTLGGSILSQDLKEVSLLHPMWITVEFGVNLESRTPKSHRMYPIAIKHADQEWVFKLHKDFFEKTWEEKTQGWLSPSSILDIAALIGEPAVIIFPSIPEPGWLALFKAGLSKQPGGGQNRQQLDLNSMATVWGDTKKLYYESSKGAKIPPWKENDVRLMGRSVSFVPFRKWLEEAARPVKAYLAVDLAMAGGYGLDEGVFYDARLYAAFEDGFGTADVAKSLELPEVLHSEPVRSQIRRCVPDCPLDKLWEDTREWFANELVDHKPEHLLQNPARLMELREEITKYLGPIPPEWCADIKIFEPFLGAVKTILGSGARVNGGRDPVSPIGGYLLLLMGVCNALKGSPRSSDHLEKAKDIPWNRLTDTAVRYSHLFSAKSDRDSQRQVARWLFRLGEVLGSRERETPLLLRPIVIEEGYAIAAYLDTNPVDARGIVHRVSEAMRDGIGTEPVGRWGIKELVSSISKSLKTVEGGGGFALQRAGDNSDGILLWFLGRNAVWLEATESPREA